MKKTLALVIAMVMYLGKCVERATSDELFANPRHPYTKALLTFQLLDVRLTAGHL